VYANIQKFIQFQLTVNVGALVINVVAAVSSGDVPLNTVQVSLSLTHVFLSLDQFNLTILHSPCVQYKERNTNSLLQV
jgi:magnesium-transporting ATPase (P-type)